MPALLLFFVVLAIPLGFLLASSLTVEGSVSLAHYRGFFSDPHRLEVLRTTILYGSVVTFAALLVAYPYAYAMAQAPGWLQTVLLLGVFLPMTTSVIVKAFGWTVLLRSSGPVNQALMALGITESPVRLLLTEAGLYVGTVSLLLPYMVLPIYAVLRLVPPALHEAAATLGASAFYGFTRVTLPLSLPGVLTGVAFVFSMTVAAYVIPSLLAGARFQVLSKVAANAFLTVDNPKLGATVSVLLLGICIAVAALGVRMARVLNHQR